MSKLSSASRNAYIECIGSEEQKGCEDRSEEEAPRLHGVASGKERELSHTVKRHCVRWNRGGSTIIIACVAKQIEVRNVKTFPENGSGSPAATTLQAGKMSE